MRTRIYFIGILFLVMLCYKCLYEEPRNEISISENTKGNKVMTGVYWVGTNGQVYTKAAGQNGVQSIGSGGSGVTLAKTMGYSQIADPAVGNFTAPTAIATGFHDPSGAYVGGTGGIGNVASTGPVGPSAAQTDPLLASLSTLDTILTNKNQQSQDEYGRAIQGYDDQDVLDARAHDQNVQQNESAYTSNNQAALLNAANASTGLRGVLASLHALGGSGIDIVKKLVGLAANNDTGAARQNFTTNATNVGQAWEQATQGEKQRRADASATLSNNLQNNKAGVSTSRQSIYEQLANLFGSDAAEGKTYASKAAALAPEIAATSRASVAPYQKASSLFSPAALQDYLAGTQKLNVSTSGDSSTPINSPIFGAKDKKDQLVGVA